jgi:ElaB/YqjD/DUF883 family membrane-anchored ribosome-binding protein
MKSKASQAPSGGNFQTTLERGVDAATDAAHDTIDSVSDAARPALDQIVSGAHGAVDRAGDAAAHAAGTLGAKGDQLNNSGKRMVNRAENYLHEHPVASLGMAVAAGYLLSRLLSSR